MTNKKKNTAKKSKTNKLLDEKKNEIKNLHDEINLLNEKNVKLLAEFDNFQRRTLDEKENMKKFQNLDFVKDFLPAIDDLDRVIEFDEIQDNNSMLEAIKMIKTKINKILNKYLIGKLKD